MTSIVKAPTRWASGLLLFSLLCIGLTFVLRGGVVEAAILPDIVYVDDDWAALPKGTDPDGAGPATSIDFDAFATVQGGIDGVAANGTVNVAAGTYAEQPVVGKNLTLNGAGAGATNITAPSTLVTRFNNFYILFEVNGGASVEASGITVKGPLNLNGCRQATPFSTYRRYYGVYVRGGAALNLHDSSVLDIRENNPAPNTNCLSGTAINAGATVAGLNQTGTLTLTDTTVSGFQARGVIVDNAGSTGDFVIRADGSTCFGYELDIPDNAGIALFRTSDTTNFSSTTRLDAVGSMSEPNALYREGAGYPALTPADIDANLEHSFYRSLCSFVGGLGCTTPGVARDSQDNASDFQFVDTEGTLTAAGRRLGAPGPENLLSPVQRNGLVGLVPLDRTVSAASAPNRVRDFAEDAANNSTFGTLTVRRRVTNLTGAPVTSLRFRVVEVTTYPSPAGTADLRVRASEDETVVGVVDAETCASLGAAPCTVEVRGTLVEQPSVQPNGGGYNSSLAVGTVTLSSPLQPGESVNVRFLLGIQQTGTFRFLLNIEAVNAGPH